MEVVVEVVVVAALTVLTQVHTAASHMHTAAIQQHHQREAAAHLHVLHRQTCLPNRLFQQHLRSMSATKAIESQKP